MARLVAEVRRGPPGALGGVLVAGRIDRGRGLLSHGRARRFPSYALAFVTAGTGRYRGRRQDVPLRAGSLIYITPGEPHWYGVVDQSTWDEVYLIFDGPLFALAEAQGVIDRNRPVRSLAPVSYWLHRIERFRTRRPPRTPAQRDAEASEVLRLLIDVQASGEPPAPAATDDWFVSSQEGLEADLGEPLDLARIARGVGMAYETWRRRFRDRAGVPPARYRLQRRLDAATALLEYTTLTTHDIAITVGFCDEHHLNRHFRVATGLSARQYRRVQSSDPETAPEDPR